MRTVLIRRFVLVAASLAAATLLFGCTSSGDGGVGDIDDQLARGADLVVDPNTAPNQRAVFLEQAASTRDAFCADVQVASVVDLYAVAFMLQYDASLMEFRGFTTGPFLGSSSELLVEVDVDEDPVTGLGTITVGLTRTMDAPGVTGSSEDDGPLITLCWDLLATGTSQLTFVGNRVGFNSNGTTIPDDVEIPESGFIDNSVVITQ